MKSLAKSYRTGSGTSASATGSGASTVRNGAGFRCLGLGISVEGRAIQAYLRPGSTENTTMILAGFHGDEPKGVFVARRLIELLSSDPTAGLGIGWMIVPVVNPDGYERRKRRNAHGIDLNRNFPTKNWELSSRRSRMFGGTRPGGEPETLAVIEAVRRYPPRRIISIHSISGGRECNNHDGPARAIAEAMHRVNGYPVSSSIGYPTPGSFGTWAGVEQEIPIVTLELPSTLSSKRCWEDNRGALLCSH